MNQTILYLECNSGISGDMTAAALLDLGASREVLEKGLASLPLTGYSVRISDVYKSGLKACDFDVILDKAHENHDHDMEYLHGNGHAHAHAAVHTHEHAAADCAPHTHAHSASSHEEHPHNHPEDSSGMHVHGHHHDARNLRDIIQILEHSELTVNARKLAVKIFTVLAEAEASVHGKTMDEVHFHEVGAVDSIVDIAAA
ncbi:MAG: DUF111 family protein, partial [Lachnospiraceae bacterium]|nr:DUF111 family protein [Lachnospiraceae bacterium]